MLDQDVNKILNLWFLEFCLKYFFDCSAVGVEYFRKGMKLVAHHMLLTFDSS